MVKVCELEYPKGSFPGQKSDGFYMDGTYQKNLDVIAKKVGDDMDFVLIISGKGMVRNGKSSLLQQTGTYLTWKINQLHGTKNTFTEKNITFKGEDIISTGLSFSPMHVIGLDEGDDLTQAHFSKEAVRLRRFFRKCGQLNHIIILVIPDFFELPRTYAVTRSICLINAHFEEDFQRGYFQFYNHKAKKLLYLKGKRWGDYDCVRPGFIGRFPKLYTIDEKKYRKKKMDDLRDEDIMEKKTTPQIQQECKLRIIGVMKKHESKLTEKQMSELTGIPLRTISRYSQIIKEKLEKSSAE